MSLRLIRKNRKGIELEDGRIIWQMMGAEGEGDPADDENENEEEDNDEDDESESDSKKKPEDEIESSYKKRMRAADRRAAALEAKLQEIELAGKSELEQTKVKLEQSEAANQELAQRLSTLQRERSFLGSNTVTWHDPEIAMSKLDWDSIIDEDGDVNQGTLEKAIKDLAKNKPFLVKSETTSSEDNKPDGENARQPSGSKVGNGKKQTKESVDREALLRKYPALR